MTPPLRVPSRPHTSNPVDPVSALGSPQQLIMVLVHVVHDFLPCVCIAAPGLRFFSAPVRGRLSSSPSHVVVAFGWSRCRRHASDCVWSLAVASDTERRHRAWAPRRARRDVSSGFDIEVLMYCMYFSFSICVRIRCIAYLSVFNTAHVCSDSVHTDTLWGVGKTKTRG